MKKINETVFVAIDLEATYSKYFERHEIIEVGACRLEPPDFNISKSFETLVRPPCPIIPAIQQKTGLTDTMVSAARRINEVWESLFVFLTGSTLIVYQSIDITILRKTSEAYKLPAIDNCFIDIFRLVKIVYPDEPSYALEHFKKKLNISIDSHRAGSDAYVTAILFKHLMGIMESKYQIFDLDRLSIFCQTGSPHKQTQLFL